MKKIDRYVAKAYITRFLMAHLIIFGLYVSFDIMQRVDVLYQADEGQSIVQILVYYLYQLPSNIMVTVPPLLMLSAGLVFVNMNRNGELVTLKAVGISVQRITKPIFIITLPVILFLAFAQETLIPDLYRQRRLIENKIEERAFGPFLLRDTDPETGEEYEFFVGSYDFKSATIKNISLLYYHDAANIPRKTVEADYAQWAGNNSLELSGVQIQEFDRRGNVSGESLGLKNKKLYTTLSINDFIDAQDDDLTTRAPAMTLRSLWTRKKANPHNPRFKVLFHSRIADNLVPLILLLIGIPLLAGYGRNHNSRLVGSLIALMVIGVYYMLTFVTLSMGNADLVNPTAAAWAMPVIGTLCGLTVFFKMPT